MNFIRDLSFNTAALNQIFWLRSGLFSLVWGLFLGATVFAYLSAGAHRQFSDVALACLFSFAGAVIAMLIARLFVTIVFSRQPLVSKHIMMFVLLTVGTIGLVALLFAIHFRTYFAQWHAPAFTIYWIFQFIFTVAYSVYLFASGFLHYLVSPLNVALAAAFSWLACPK